MHRADHLMREVHQVRFVLEMAGIDSVGHVRFGRPIRTETAHLFWRDRVQKPILILIRLLVRPSLALAGLPGLLSDRFTDRRCVPPPAPRAHPAPPHTPPP